MTSDRNTSSRASGGIGLGGAVFLVFLVLKLTGVIGWSWWWVTVPLWGGLAILLAIAVLLLVGLGIARVLRRIREGRAAS